MTTTAPDRAVDARPGQRAGELVERIVAADILARLDDALAGNVEAGGMNRAGLGMQRLDLRQKLDRLNDVVGASSVSGDAPTLSTARIASSIDSMPQSPQPTGPASRRRRASKRVLA